MKFGFVPTVAKEEKETLNDKMLRIVHSRDLGLAGEQNGYPFCYIGYCKLDATFNGRGQYMFALHWWADHEWQCKLGYLTEHEVETFVSGDGIQDLNDVRFKYLDAILSEPAKEVE